MADYSPLTQTQTNILTPVNNQQINGVDIATVADGVQLISLAGPTGDALDTIGNSLRVFTGSQVALDSSGVPSEVTIVGGESNDALPQYNPIPLGTTGRSVIVEGFTGATSVPVYNGLFPSGTALNTSANHITTNTTVTPTSTTCYVSVIVISVASTGTTSTVTIQDKSGTPKKLVAGLGTASALTSGNDTYTFQTPVLMTGGVDIITAGAAAATVDVWVNFYQ